MEAIRPRYRGGLGGSESVARAVRLIRWFLSAATTFLSSGGVNQLKAGVGRRFVPRSATRGPVGLPSMWVQGVSRLFARLGSSGPSKVCSAAKKASQAPLSHLRLQP
jgi:hypothetical protein